MWKISIILFVLLGNLFTWSIFLHENNREFLTVNFLDVGQGDAIFIEAPNGKQVLIDTGPDDSIVRTLHSFLPYYDRHFDQIITTHPDLDHIGGTPTILERYKIDYYSFFKESSQSEITKKIENLLFEKGITLSYLEAGDRIMIDEKAGIFLDILWPSSKFQTEEKNDLSIVAKLTYQQTSFLMMGDASIKIENFLLEEFGDKLDIDILKLGHHGSKTSSAYSFIEITSPQKVVISASANNNYGHPHKEVLENLQKYLIQKKIKSEDFIKKTSDLGSIVFQSDGEKIWLK